MTLLAGVTIDQAGHRLTIPPTAPTDLLARIAGIGGVTVGVLLILFREVLRRTVFSRISPDHSYQLLRLVVVFTGIVAIGGLATRAMVARKDE